MLGNTRADESASNAEAGIIPHSLNEIFIQLKQKEKKLKFGESYVVTVCFMEVYNEQVYDLLETSGKVLSLREDQEREIVIVAGITETAVTSYEQVMELLHQGNRNRKTESTLANSVSSRSHAILQMNIKHTLRRESTGRDSLIESKLSLIDLAGSERASATNNRGARLMEGANINKSLLALANCINALSENSLSSTGSAKTRLNVKYRDSKLTHLLKSSLEGNCNLVMIANINPADSTYDDSLNTLKYANRAKNIKVSAGVKETAKDSTWVEREAKMREENALLRARVAELETEVLELREFRAQIEGSRLPERILSAARRMEKKISQREYFECMVSLQDFNQS
jgi:kinesin family protein 18/19